MEFGIMVSADADGFDLRRDVGITPYGIGRNGCIPLLIAGVGVLDVPCGGDTIAAACLQKI
ncbi:MAG: hypothetical protein II379_04255, partial [Oscillospiraceae bacterium]|nr:hypothetical protein [Oscillospiraceae bacterium]